MGVALVSPQKYRSLVAKALPKVLESGKELEHFSGILESFDRLERKLTPEEKALEALLARLIRDYDERVDLPAAAPHEVVLHLMAHRGLRPVDLLPVFGSRSVASACLSGKPCLSKTHIRRLGEFFHLSPAAFPVTRVLTPKPLDGYQPHPAAISVRPKSSPVKSSGIPATGATAYAIQSPKFSAAGCRPRPNRRNAAVAASRCSS